MFRKKGKLRMSVFDYMFVSFWIAMLSIDWIHWPTTCISFVVEGMVTCCLRWPLDQVDGQNVEEILRLFEQNDVVILFNCFISGLCLSVPSLCSLCMLYQFHPDVILHLENRSRHTYSRKRKKKKQAPTTALFTKLYQEGLGENVCKYMFLNTELPAPL